MSIPSRQAVASVAIRTVAVGAMSAGAAGLVVQRVVVQRSEARATAAILRPLIGSAQTIGTAVILPVGSGDQLTWVGFAVTTGCTVALLGVPFLLVAAALVAAGRASVPRALRALGFAGAALLAGNLTRLVLLGLGVRWLGFPEGFDRLHVVLGATASTAGLALGILGFVRTLLGHRTLEQTA